MKLITFFLAFTLSMNVWAGSDDESEDAETEEPSLEEMAAEAKALELLGDDPAPSSLEAVLGTDALLESARSVLGANPEPTRPMESTPPVLEQTLDAPTSGRQGGPPVVRELPPEKEPAKPPQAPALYQGQKWREQYHSGRELSKKGFVMGGVGTGLVLGGALVMVITDDFGGGFVLGALVGVGGLGTIWAGSAVTAAGTYRTHSALAKGGLASPVCVGCIGAWATAVYAPTVPVSYLISGGKHIAFAEIYRENARGKLRSSGIRLAPVFGQAGAGLSVKGAF